MRVERIMAWLILRRGPGRRGAAVPRATVARVLAAEPPCGMPGSGGPRSPRGRWSPKPRGGWARAGGAPGHAAGRDGGALRHAGRSPGGATRPRRAWPVADLTPRPPGSWDAPGRVGVEEAARGVEAVGEGLTSPAAGVCRSSGRPRRAPEGGDGVGPGEGGRRKSGIKGEGKATRARRAVDRVGSRAKGARALGGGGVGEAGGGGAGGRSRCGRARPRRSPAR